MSAIEQELLTLDPRQARLEGSKSLLVYGKLFFPRTFRQKSPEFHAEIGRALYGPDRYNCFIIFRDAAKTSLLRVFTSQRIAYGISNTIMYVSVSQPHAIFSLRWLKRQVQFNRKWAECFSLRKGEKWSDEWLEILQDYVDGGEVKTRVITVLAMGITGQIRGFNPDDYRPDLIIADDLLNEENTGTKEQRQKMEALFFGSLMNSLAPESEAPFAKGVLLGTPLHKEDLLSTCEKDRDWHTKRFSVFNERHESRWETRWPTEVLNREKQAHIMRGQYRLWMREKEVAIVSGVDKAINVENFQYYELLPEYFDTIIAIDPAPGSAKDIPAEEQKTDDHAIVAVGFRNEDIYILDYALAKAVMPDKAANDFFTLVLRWSPRKAAVESILYQKTLKWYIEQEMVKRRIFVAIDAVVDKRSKANRIMQSIPGLVNYKHFFIRKEHSELITQADDYDPNVKEQPDDLLDAIAMAIVAMNPALRLGQNDDAIEGQFERIRNDEERYAALEFGGAP